MTSARLPVSPEQARSIQRQGRVLEAAVGLLLRGGGAAVTHRRVAEESDSSPGVVRYYFRTREDLLAACLDRMELARHDVAEQILGSVRGDAAPDQTARWALEIFCGERLDDAAVMGTIWSIVDCARESPRLAALLGTHRHAAQEQLGVLLSRCGYGDVEPSLVTAVLNGSILSTTLEAGTAAAESAATELARILRIPRSPSRSSPSRG